MSSNPEWTAIILAGQRPGENAFAQSHGVAAKALIPVCGVPMLGRVARTILDCPSVARVAILAQDPQLLAQGDLQWLASEPRISFAIAADGISTSLLACAGGPVAPWPVLVVTADHVLLEPFMVEQFIDQVGNADAAFAVVDRRVVEARYPQTKRTWMRFSDGDFTGANLFALRGPASRAALSIWSEVERDRKKAMRLMMYFGPLLALRAFTRTISLDRALAKVAAKVGLDVAAVRLPFADAAVDVDKPQDLELASEVLRKRGIGSAPDNALALIGGDSSASDQNSRPELG